MGKTKILKKYSDVFITLLVIIVLFILYNAGYIITMLFKHCPHYHKNVPYE